MTSTPAQFVHLRAEFRLAFDSPHDSPLIMVLRPRIDQRQTVLLDRFEVTPSLPVVEYVDVHGNRCQRLTLPEGHCELKGAVEARVEDQLSWDWQARFVSIPDLPNSVLQYLLPSRYCESDHVGGLALDIVGDTPPGLAQVGQISDWIHQNVKYRPGSGMDLLTAEAVLARRQGVCRDLAHLGIALCRSLSIPARFVSGYLDGLDPMDLHAWFEVWMDGRWHGVDPSQPHRQGGRIRIGVGRDGADVPIFNRFGPPLEPSHLSFEVRRF